MSPLCYLFFIFPYFTFCTGCSAGWMHFKEQCYLFAKSVDTWAGGQSIWAAMHGKLAEPRTQAELDYIAAVVNSMNGHGVGQYWIGINDIAIDNRWEYTSDDSVLTVTGWGPNEPNGNVDENCVAAAAAYSGMWADIACGRQLHYICEKLNNINGGTEIIG